MKPLPQPEAAVASRALRLKALTRETHERLDQSVMAAASFASRGDYARFVASQFLFHRDIDALYDHDGLRALLPGLRDRRRLPLLTRDLADLGAPAPSTAAPPVFAPGEPVDMPVALGWLYVAEGSRMGAALLRKEAAKIGLSDDHGARHLAPAPEGPAAQWRAFVAALDTIALDPDEDARVIAAATTAFARVQSYVDQQIG